MPSAVGDPGADDARPDDPAAVPSKEAPHAGGFTLDLSSGPSAGQPEAWRRKRKQASPILTKIVDLTTPKAEAPPPPRASTPRPDPKPRPPRDEKRRDSPDKAKKPGGATLADLLDEATLARLRGGE